jgi:hypothetical protein
MNHLFLFAGIICSSVGTNIMYVQRKKMAKYKREHLSFDCKTLFIGIGMIVLGVGILLYTILLHRLFQRQTSPITFEKSNEYFTSQQFI